jgi:hypothetical protein
MRWVLSVFRFGRGPVPLREIPETLAKWVVFGAVTGPFWAFFFTFFNSPSDALLIFESPVTLFWASVTGVVFSVCFFVACGLGNGYLRRYVKDYPPAIVRVVFVIYNAAAASLVRGFF